jgi:signal transduction histidine kinase
LRGLAERVAQLGGTFSVANGATGGVELGAAIPLGVAA